MNCYCDLLESALLLNSEKLCKIFNLQLHQARDGYVFRGQRGNGGHGKTKMDGPETTNGLQKVRNSAS